MRAIAFVPVAFLVAGAVLVVLAVVTGGAAFGIALIVPFVVGRSLDLGLGVLLLVLGFLTLPLGFAGSGDLSEERSEAPPPAAGGGSGGAGGFVIVGPVPILFGSWRNVSARTRLLIAIGAAAAFLAVVVVVLVAFG
jgi:uncharacterized protein (TIGR00304 family)